MLVELELQIKVMLVVLVVPKVEVAVVLAKLETLMDKEMVETVLLQQ